jgi:hypothetical protein
MNGLDQKILGLSNLFTKHGSHFDPSSVKTWIGPTPSASANTLSSLFANVGLESAVDRHSLSELVFDDACLYLSLYLTQSLNHGGSTFPNAELIHDVRQSIGLLGSNATYLSMGIWQFTRRGKRYETLTRDSQFIARRHMLHFAGHSLPYFFNDKYATNGGVLGFDEETAFIFWREEDD